MTWTPEQVGALAPDAAALKAGRELATARKWSSLGRDEQALWGECKGSGANPYQTRIDLSEPAFKCSCPSRKFPCKHALGLFLLTVQEPSVVAPAARPPWVEEWLAARRGRAEKKVEKESQAAAEPLTEARRTKEQEKRASNREARVLDGLADLELWLADIVRQGLASLRDKPYRFYEQQAARLVDAQAPGLARLVSELSTPHDGAWPGRTLEKLAHLFVVVRGYQRLDAVAGSGLKDNWRDELRSAVGWSTAREEIERQELVTDEWCVLGSRVLEDDKLKVHRAWLWGSKSNRPALILTFSPRAQPLVPPVAAGSRFSGSLAFYPAAVPLRALLIDREQEQRVLTAMPGATAWDAALTNVCEARQRNPWIESYPLPLCNMRPFLDGDSLHLVDDAAFAIPLSCDEQSGFTLLALSGGGPIDLFGEWNGTSLTVLSAIVDQRFVGF